MYRLDIDTVLLKVFHKLAKKDRVQLEAINKKVKEILQNPLHYKPLRHDMKNIRRVHILKSFVLTYKIDEEKKKVKLLDYVHHDEAY
jgi:YafQ family addiction module toxin component